MSQVRVRFNPPKTTAVAVQHEKHEKQLPLTHHEMLALMPAFSAQGLHADLKASRREVRMIAFQPRDHAATETAPALREVLFLWVAAPEAGDRQPTEFELVRRVEVLEDPDAAWSTLRGSGKDLALLLEQVLAVPLSRQIERVGELLLARDYVLGTGDFAGRPEFAEARVQFPGMRLEAVADRRGGYPLEYKLTPQAGQRICLAEDLVAVLGRGFRPMTRFVSYWRGSIKVPRKEPERTPEIERQLKRALSQLQACLARPPSDFHTRFRWARWQVTFRRALPLLIGIGLLMATPAIRFIDLEEHSLLRMLIFHLPPFMLVGFFLMREMPKLEIPPLPRPLRQRQWIEPIQADGRRQSQTSRILPNEA